jgi:endogenous inhibitor of DNA gyrase (YacG/DUF329 family)
MKMNKCENCGEPTPDELMAFCSFACANQDLRRTHGRQIIVEEFTLNGKELL